MTRTRKLINLIAAPLVVVAALLLAAIMVKSKKAPPVRKPDPAAARVVVLEAKPGTVRPKIHTYGNTRSHLTTSIASLVGGEILRVSPAFEAGGRVARGDWLVKINPVDLQSVLSERVSALAAARQTLTDQQTRAQLAREDWLASGRKIEDASDFTLRIPQLRAAEAAREAAEALVAKAELDVERCTVRAPFDAMVESRSASPGNVISAGTTLGTLLSRDKIEVRLPLTPQQIRRLDLSKIADRPLTGSVTTPTLPGKTWITHIARIEPAIDPSNQTLWVIGEIDDPFSNPDALLPVGAFVNVVLEADAVEDVYTLPEVSVVEDAYVWVVRPDNTLARQPIEMVFSQEGTILARIEQPAFGLPLRIARRPLASFRADQAVIPEVSREG